MVPKHCKSISPRRVIIFVIIINAVVVDDDDDGNFFFFLPLILFVVVLQPQFSDPLLLLYPPSLFQLLYIQGHVFASHSTENTALR